MSELQPFEYLAQLSGQIKQAAPELPSREEVRNTWSAIGFSILGKRFVAPLGEVVEMLPVPEATKLPGVQPWVLGLANVRGRLLPMFDLEAFFGHKLSSNKVRHRVLIIELGDLYAGLVVSEVFGMQAIMDDVEPEALGEELNVVSPYSKGFYEKEGLVWSTFSPFSLIRDPRFFNAASAA